MTNERKIKWNYPLIDVSENKVGSKTITPRNSAYELVGADCSVKGGIRPFPGFHKIHEFSDLVSQTNMDAGSEIIDVFPVSFRISTDKYGYGFVYRAKQKADSDDPSLSSIFIDYYTEEEEWTLGIEITTGITAADPMDVQVFGRYVYILVKGVEPSLFYVKYEELVAASCSATLLDSTKLQVGDVLTLIATDDITTITATIHEDTTSNTDTDAATFAFDDDVNIMAGNLQTCLDVNDKLSASVVNNQVTITQATAGSDGNNITTWTLNDSGGASKSNFSGGTGTGSSDYYNAIETDTGPGIQMNTIAPDTAEEVEVGTLAPPSETGAVSHAQIFVGTSVGSYWDSTPEGMDDVANLEAGNYAMAYVLNDPDTGRKTSLSKLAQLKQEHLVDKATGTITTLSSTLEDYDGKIITIGDGSNVVEFTFEDEGTTAKVSNTEYTIGIDTEDIYYIAEDIYDAISLANTNNDLKITPTWTGPTNVVNLVHNIGTEDGNVAIIEDIEDAEKLVVTGMSGAGNFDPGNVGMEIVYDTSKFSQAYIYRSVRVQDAGGSYAAAVVQLDKIIDLADYLTTDQTGMTGDFQRAIYYYTLPDLALIYQDPYIDRSIFDENMPKAGTGIEFDGIFLTSNIEGSIIGAGGEIGDNDRFRGVGEFRWSSMAHTNPELFPPENYYVPSKIANQVITFERSGGTVLGFANNSVMHIAREFTGTLSYLKILPIHEGYGLVNKRAVQTVGPFVYYLNDKGLKTIDAQARLDSLHALDGLIEEWKDDLDSISMSYDAKFSTLYILNSVKQESAVLWFNTSMVSELHDMPFSLTVTGQWPSDLSNDDSDLVERGMFLQNQPDASNPDVSFTPCIWVTDTHREDTTGECAASDFDNTQRTTLLHYEGDTRFEISAVGSGTFTLNSATTGHQSVAPTLLADAWIGAYVYCIGSATESNIGSKAQIQSTDGTVITYQNKDVSWTPAVGDRVGISPVYMRWEGSIIGFNEAQNPQEPNINGLHITRTINSSGCYFSEVSGNSFIDTVDTTDIFYRFLIFEGNSNTPVSKGIPKNLSGSLIKSIFEGESTYWASPELHGVRGMVISPGVEVFCPDLDFHLLSVIIEGKILSSIRTERPT